MASHPLSCYMSLSPSYYHIQVLDSQKYFTIAFFNHNKEFSVGFCHCFVVGQIILQSYFNLVGYKILIY